MPTRHGISLTAGLAARRGVVAAAQVVCASMLLSMTPRARADEVVLVQGDVLIGEIVESGDTVLVIRHAVLGRLEVPVVEVAAVRRDDCDPEKIGAASAST